MEGAGLKSFIEYNSEHHFPLENIPFGCYKSGANKIHCCSRIGDKIIDLADLFIHMKDGEYFKSLESNIFD